MPLHFVVDQRSANQSAMQLSLQRILAYGGDFLASIQNSSDAVVLLTDMAADGSGIPSGDSQIISSSVLALNGPDGWNMADWNYTHTGVGSIADLVGSGPNQDDQIDVVILMESSIISGGQDIATFAGIGATGHFDLDRVLFHELSHFIFNNAMFQGGRNGVVVGFNEELAVFSENLLYNRLSPTTNSDHGVIRYGHQSELTITGYQPVTWSGNGVSGVDPFLAYSEMPTLSITSDSADFTATSTTSTFNKSYKKVGYEVDGFTYDHYIKLTETAQLPVISITTIQSSPTARLEQIMGSMQTDASLAGLNKVSAAISILGAASHAFTVNTVVGLGADAFVDNYQVYAGVSRSGDNPTPAKIAIDQSGSGDSSIIFGAAGAAGWNGDLLRGSASATSILISTGQGNNELYGGQADDILIGSAGNDKMVGGGGNDIFIPGRGTNEIQASGGTVYYGDETTGIHVNSTRVIHDGGNGLRAMDPVSGVTAYIGTSSADEFFGSGGKTYYGNGGSDTFFAADAPDRFFGLNGVISGTISYKGLTVSDTRISEYSTSLGHVTHRPNILIGSDQRDYIEASRAEIHGGGGNDVIKTGLRDAYGDEGDDTFIPQSGTYAVTLHGGIGNDIINLPSLVGVAPGHYWYLDWRSPSYHAFGYIDGSFGLTTHYTLDSIEGYTYDPTLVAVNILLPTAIANTFTGTDYNDVITGGDLGDTLRAGGAYVFVSVANVINGGGGNDTIYGATNGGSAYNGDRLDGGSDDDTIWGSASKDTILGGQGGDYLHGGGGNDNFYDELGTNYIYGDAGSDVLHLEGWRTTDLNFGTAGAGWRYVSAKNGAFIDYITTVEQIVTMNGTVNVTYAANGFRGGEDNGDAPAFSSTDSDGFDFSGFEPINGPDDDLMAEELSFTGEGIFNVDSDWTETSDQIQAHGLENMALNMDMMPIHLVQPALADYGFLI